MTASQRPGDGREEAAAQAMHAAECGCDGPDDPMYHDYARQSLAAADLWDRENGIVRVKLDGTLATPGGFTYLSNLLGSDPTRETLLAVAAALREAAEQ